jgi:HK97 family phage major capsid protein
MTMARVNVDQWIREEYGSPVDLAVRQNSAVENLARREPMGTDTKTLNRYGDVGVAVTAKGSAYNEEQPTGDEVTLTARKFTAVLRIAEEDIADLPASGVANYVSERQRDWASSYARFLDNACLGVSAAANGTTIPFTSAYRAVTTADAGVGYVANANHINTQGAVTYADLSALLAISESGEFFDPGNTIVIAHPSFLATIRGMLGSDGRPIFEGNAQAGGNANLFGIPLQFSVGAKVSATATRSPGGAGGAKGTAGNPLMYVAHRQHLILGVRSGPEYFNIPGSTGAAALTDENLIKMRSRRAFSVGDPRAIAVLEASTV